ncbi:MAG: YjbQ family protein [Verrucomicrobia bacterium]|nr:YjbQ family protein [Verrucomicrobiota bacterium]
MISELALSTRKRAEFVHITAEVQRVVRESGVDSGTCIVYVPHTTAGVTINENADPDVERDILDQLEHIVPRQGAYHHLEGNADAHIKAAIMGSSVTVLVEKGALVLGTWQGLFFCEFDGPRSRHVYVKVIADPR